MKPNPRDNPANWMFHLYDEPTTERIKSGHPRDAHLWKRNAKEAAMTTYSHDAKALAKWGQRVRDYTDIRNEAIVQAHRDGMSLREVADAVGLSHMGVQAIVKRQTQK